MDARLIKLFRKLSSAEQRRLCEWTQCTLINKRPEVSALCAYMAAHAARFPETPRNRHDPAARRPHRSLTKQPLPHRRPRAPLAELEAYLAARVPLLLRRLHAAPAAALAPHRSFMGVPSPRDILYDTL